MWRVSPMLPKLSEMAGQFARFEHATNGVGLFGSLSVYDAARSMLDMYVGIAERATELLPDETALARAFAEKDEERGAIRKALLDAMRADVGQAVASE